MRFICRKGVIQHGSIKWAINALSQRKYIKSGKSNGSDKCCNNVNIVKSQREAVRSL
jgi:hypothetical protein